MPRPKNKEELLNAATENYKRLLDFVESLDEKERLREFPKGYLNRNIRDVLAHLHHWHLMMLDWYQVGMSGHKPDIPAKGYTWRTTHDLNVSIQKMYADKDLKDVTKQFKTSHKKVYDLIVKHSDEELFEKKRYGWTGSTSLGAYLISSTSSHYDWGFKLIKKCLR